MEVIAGLASAWQLLAEILHLAVSIDTCQTTERIEDGCDNMNLFEKLLKVELGKPKCSRSVKSTTRGDKNLVRVGNGKLDNGERRKVIDRTEGHSNVIYAGNTSEPSGEKDREVLKLMHPGEKGTRSYSGSCSSCAHTNSYDRVREPGGSNQQRPLSGRSIQQRLLVHGSGKGDGFERPDRDRSRPRMIMAKRNQPSPSIPEA